MANETAKATKRRLAESDAGVFPWRDIFKGRMIDVGAGDDPLSNSIPFDTKDGDANHLSQYFEPESFDVLHASHCLEHMRDPHAALRDWLTLVKPGGYVVQTVPDIGAYERFTYPSKHNPDHKASFSMIYKGSPFPIHCHIPTFLESFSDIGAAILARYVEENYDWKKPPTIDQTWIEADGVEVWNEWVIRKRKRQRAKKK